MKNLIQLNDAAIKTTLDILLLDRTTEQNIIWATNSYNNYGKGYDEKDEIIVESIKGLKTIDIQPRVLKTLEAQKNRTKKRAEVFTPSWICNKMNNSCDEQWFGHKNVFNVENDDKTWTTQRDKIQFTNKKTWQDYVLLRQLEITCGEAPYLVSRYDTTTGELINIKERIGLLDRKLRVINENTNTEDAWFEWVVKAYQSTYGYEFQGDNLLIARTNLILTFVDYMNYKWQKEPTEEQLKTIATIISWNVWQMDGLTYEVPLGGPSNKTNDKLYSKIIDWQTNSVNTFCFKDI